MAILSPGEVPVEPTLKRIDAMLWERWHEGMGPWKRLLICRKAFDLLYREMRGRNLTWGEVRYRTATLDETWEAAHKGYVYILGVRLVPCEDCYLFIPTEGSGQ